MKIIIAGTGNWGPALGTVLAANNKKFEFLKPGQKIPSNSILIMCVPTQNIRGVLETSARDAENVIYVNGAKGIEKTTRKLPFQIASEVLDSETDYFSLIGPSFAQEVKDRMPTLVNIGYTKEENAKLIHDLFENDYFRVRLTRGVKALELASAFKNVYAIACGLADGLGFQTNTRVKLILLAIEEFYRLSKKLGYKIDGRALPGTIGDLILTCNSPESRNFSFGKLLARDKTDQALKKIGETVEGFHTVDSVPYFEESSKMKLQLARFVFDIVKSDDPSSAKQKFQNFVKNT